MPPSEFVPQLPIDKPNPRTRLRGRPVIERLMYRTSIDGECWTWRGSANPKGYGHIQRDRNGGLVAVYVVAYEHFVGPVPVGLEIDHLCSNRRCVNPDHLEAITHAENVRRGRHNQNHGKTECIKGHPFDASNTHFLSTGKRSCRACARRRTAEHRVRSAA